MARGCCSLKKYNDPPFSFDLFSSMLSWRVAAAGVAVVAYALASHALMTHAADRPWAVLVIFAPLLLAVFGWAVRQRHRATLWATLAVFVLLGVVVARGGVGDVNRLYVAQHAGIHALLCLSFAATLRRGERSLIGRLASQVHRTMSADMWAYTRRVTQVWAVYFLGMTLASLTIYAVCEWSTWSVFANLATPLSALALFVGEYLARYALHPEFERVTLADAVRAWQQHSGGAALPPSSEVRP